MDKLERITAQLQAEARDPLYVLRVSEELEAEKRERARREALGRRYEAKAYEALLKMTVLNTVHKLGAELFESWLEWCDGKREFAGGVTIVGKRRREGIEKTSTGCTMQLLRYRDKDLCDVCLPDGVWLGSYHMDKGYMQLAIRDAVWRVVDYLKDPCDKNFWKMKGKDNG